MCSIFPKTQTHIRNTRRNAAKRLHTEKKLSKGNFEEMQKREKMFVSAVAGLQQLSQ